MIRTAPERRRRGLEPAARVDLFWSAGVLSCALLAILALQFLPGVALPVLLPLFLAWALDPAVDRLEARGWSRTLVIVALGSVLTVGLGLVLAYLIPALAEQISRLPAWLQGIATRLLPLAERLLDRPLPADLHELAQELSSRAAALVKDLGPAAGRVLLRAAGGTASVFAQVVGLALAPVFLFYFLRDFDRIKAAAASLVPPRYQGQVLGRFREVDSVLAAFVRGQLTVATILGAIYAVGLTASGVKLGLVIGLLTGMASIVPYLGMGAGVVMATISVLVDWHDGSLWVAAGAGLTFVVGQVLEGSVVTPRVIGEKVGLPSVVVMLAVLLFGELLGLVGIVLAVPIAAILAVILRVLVQRYRESAFFSRSEEGQEEKRAAGDFSA